MNQDQLQGDWQQIKGKMKQQWGKLTDDDFVVAQGKMEELGGLVQKRYGVAKEDAQKQVDEFWHRHKSESLS